MELVNNAFLPIAVLSLAVVFEPSELCPKAVFAEPEVIASPDNPPTRTLVVPDVINRPAL